MIIGDKNIFAIEYNISENLPREMGFGKIWINGRFIGTSEDLIYLNGYLLRTLYELNKPTLNDEETELDKNQLFEHLRKKEDWTYRVCSTTFIDDFIIFSFLKEGKIFLLWKLEQESFFDDLKNYSKEVQLESISTEVLEDVIKKVEHEFRGMEILA